MTAKQAIEMLEGYYGKYERPGEEHPLTRGMVGRYLEEEFTPAELEIIVDRIIKGHSGQYRFTPDISKFEQFKDAYNDEQRDKVDGNLIGSQRPRTQTLEIGERPDGEQMLEVGDMLTGLRKKLDGALVQDDIPGFEHADPYDDEIQR